MKISKSEQTKERILKESIRLFRKKGYKDVTMTDICQATGLSRGGLYRYYSGTDEIFSEAFKQIHLSYNTIDSSRTAVEILDEMFDKIKKDILYIDGSIALALVEYVTELKKQKESEEYMRIQYFWNQILQYGISTGEFKECNIDEASDLLLYFFGGLFVWATAFDLNEVEIDRMYHLIRTSILK